MEPSSPFGHRTDPGASTDLASGYVQDPPLGSPNAPNVIDSAVGVLNPMVIRVLGYGLSVAGFGLGIYQMFRPSRLTVVALLVIPLVVLAAVLLSPPSFETGRRRRQINGLVGLSFMGLFLANTFHAQINPWWPLIPAAIGAVVVLDLAWGAKDRHDLASPRLLMAFLTLCGAAYGYGAVATADIQFDGSAGSQLSAPVLGKYVTHGRRSDSYYLNLPAWGPRLQPDSVEVSRTTYDQVNVGEPICIVLHPGALNLAWFTTHACDAWPAA
jgi:hypothetical protein